MTSQHPSPKRGVWPRGSIAAIDIALADPGTWVQRVSKQYQVSKNHDPLFGWSSYLEVMRIFLDSPKCYEGVWRTASSMVSICFKRVVDETLKILKWCVELMPCGPLFASRLTKASIAKWCPIAFAVRNCNFVWLQRRQVSVKPDNQDRGLFWEAEEMQPGQQEIS